MMKRRSILCGLACAVFMTSCGIMPSEEQLPSAPIAKEVQEIEHVMTVVQKGDLTLEDTVRCTYKPAKSETLAFKIGGEYVETIYVEAGDSVEAGDLLAELDMGDLPEQLESQQYALQTLQMNKKHIEQQKNLAIRRCNLQIQLVKEQLADLEKAGQTAASAAVPMVVSETDETSAVNSEEASSESSVPESSTPESSTPESSTPESSTPESSTPESSVPESSTPESSTPEEPEVPEEPQEPEIDIEAVKEQLNQTLKSYNQNLSQITNQYAQRLSSIEDSIYIQGKKIAEIEQAIEDRQIYAGISGSITFVREYEDGSVSVEDETVFMLADIESSVFFVTGEDAALFNIGDAVEIEYDDELHGAEVVDPQSLGLPEEEDGEIVRYLKLMQPDPSLDEGTKGEITLILESREDVLYVKSSVVKSMDGKPIVYYLDENGMKNAKEVETGLDNGDYVEIISGLEENDEIVEE